MAEFRSITLTLFMALLLLFTASGQNSSITVRAGHDVTLLCDNVIKNQQKCDATSWLSSPSVGVTTEELVNLGKTGHSVNAKAKSSRLSVTANCSLVIRNVTRDDAGRYTCRQFIRSEKPQQQGPDVQVLLSVITMAEDEVNRLVTLFCSVSTYGQCEHTVRWLHDAKHNNVQTTALSCSAKVTFPSLHPDHKSEYLDSLKCNVTDKKSRETLLCDAGLSSSCQTAGGSTSAGKNGTSSAKNATPTKQVPLWLYVVVAAASAALLAAIIIAVIRGLKKSKENQTQMDKDVGLSLNPAATPETNQDTADPEGGVCYASISYTQKGGSAAQVDVNGGDDDDDEGDAVTYSAVRASSSSSAAGASADVSALYATVNKQKNQTQQ